MATAEKTASKEGVTTSTNFSTFSVEETTESEDPGKEKVDHSVSFDGEECDKDIVLDDHQEVEV